jgi:Transposase
MKITTVGIDLAKNVFQVHAVDERGRAVLRKQLRRDQMTAFFANLPPCLIGMEACASAHHWARTLQKFGHTVRLMAPQFVKPYVKSNKNDVADAEAICEAVGRPNMRFVPIKSKARSVIGRTSGDRLPIRRIVASVRSGWAPGRAVPCSASSLAVNRADADARHRSRPKALALTICLPKEAALTTIKMRGALRWHDCPHMQSMADCGDSHGRLDQAEDPGTARGPQDHDHCDTAA